MGSERGQAAILLLGAMAVLLALGAVLASFGEAFGARGRAQRVADVAAVSGARRMVDLYPRLFEPAYLDGGAPNPRHLSLSRYLQMARDAAVEAGRANGQTIQPADVTFPDASSFGPTRVRVAVRGAASVPVAPGAERRVAVRVRARADAELVATAGQAFGAVGGDGRNPGSRSVGFGGPPRSRDGSSTLQSFVPPQYAAPLAQAAQRWNISAALLAAQLYAESNFNPFAVSGAGARGIAQFMPGTASTYGLRNPFDPVASIDAQGHLMHDLLVRFASVPLALAAYNAGPAPVARCGCVPAIPETQAYVARILGLLGGAGDLGAGGLTVRLVA